jgi:hypothetical protein
LDPPIVAPAPPHAARQQEINAAKSNHCQISINDPEDPEAIEPEEPDDPSGSEEALESILDWPINESEDDISEPSELPEESEEPEEESHAVNDDVVV